MKVNEVFEKTKDVFGMNLNQAQKLTKFLESNNLYNLLELGFAHGVSSCYMAGYIEEVGKGHLTTIDLRTAKTNRNPNIESLLSKLNLEQYVTPFFERVSYNWRLMKLIEKNKKPVFDFCYIDGAHDWYNDGFAFFLVDKLLKPGGWIIFDDINWSYNSSPSLKDSDFVKNMDDDERSLPQVGKVFDLLVKTHPFYCNFKKDGNWGYAQKKLETNIVSSGNEKVVINQYFY